ncbi:hypothetical protein EDD11_000466 [Mortierella claussenii]|nr:hypothetical protein EDD11_000466 [Mortierella claussenii]
MQDNSAAEQTTTCTSTTTTTTTTTIVAAATATAAVLTTVPSNVCTSTAIRLQSMTSTATSALAHQTLQSGSSTATTTTATFSTTATTINTPRYTTPSLPTECLHLILTHFEDDLMMLYRCLLVSTRFFHLAVRMLYKSPFRLLKAYYGDKLPWDKYQRHVKLVWLFISCILHDPRVARELPPMDPTFPVLRNPTRHFVYAQEEDDEEEEGPQHRQQAEIRKKDGMEEVSSTTTTNNMLFKRKDTFKDLTVDYLQFYTHHDHTQLSDAFPDLFPGLVCQMVEEWSRSEDMTRLRHTMEKALLNHCPETIVAMTVPISRLDAALGVVGRLSRLRRIEFVGIKNWSVPNVEEAIDFVQRHGQLTKSTGSDQIGQQQQSGGRHICRRGHSNSKSPAVSLTEIKLGGIDDSGIIQTRELYRIMQAIDSVRVVDVTGWRGAVLDILSIPTRTLTALYMRLDRPLPKKSPLVRFLAGARCLKELQLCISPTHMDCFGDLLTKELGSLCQNTAILDAINNNLDRNDDKAIQEQGQEQQEHGGRQRSGLEILSIAGETRAVGRAVTAAIRRYRGTLRVLQASSWRENTGLQFENVALGLDAGVEDEGHQEPQLPITSGSAVTNSHHVLSGNFNNDNDSSSGNDSEMESATDSDINSDSDRDNIVSIRSHVWVTFQPPGFYKSQRSHIPALPISNSSSPPPPSSSSSSSSSSLSNSTMPFLHTIDLRGEIAGSTWFDYESFSRCPHLQILRLNTQPSRFTEISSRQVEILIKNVAVGLKELELSGQWDITNDSMELIQGRLKQLRNFKMVHAKTFYPIEETDLERQRGDGDDDDDDDDDNDHHENIFYSLSSNGPGANRDRLRRCTTLSCDTIVQTVRQLPLLQEISGT